MQMATPRLSFRSIEMQRASNSVTPSIECPERPMLRLTSRDRTAHLALACDVARRLAALQIANVVIDESDLLLCRRSGNASERFSAGQSSRALATMAARFARQGCVVLTLAGSNTSETRSSLEIFTGGSQHDLVWNKIRFSIALTSSDSTSGHGQAMQEDADTIVRAILFSISHRRADAAPVVRAA